MWRTRSATSRASGAVDSTADVIGPERRPGILLRGIIRGIGPATFAAIPPRLEEAVLEVVVVDVATLRETARWTPCYQHDELQIGSS
jgi:hypothetical protein